MAHAIFVAGQPQGYLTAEHINDMIAGLERRLRNGDINLVIADFDTLRRVTGHFNNLEHDPNRIPINTQSLLDRIATFKEALEREKKLPISSLLIGTTVGFLGTMISDFPTGIIFAIGAYIASSFLPRSGDLR